MAHKHHGTRRERREPELLIPNSVVLEVMGKKFGVDFKSVEEIAEYLNKHPGARESLEEDD